MQVYVYCATRPALESSWNMEFGMFNGAYPRQGSHFRRAALDPEFSKWDQVHDFSRSDENIPMPHWTKMADDACVTWEISFPESSCKPENPVPRENNALWFMQGTCRPPGGIKTKAAQKGLTLGKQSMFTNSGVPKLSKTRL